MAFRNVEVLKITRGPLLNFWISPFVLPTPISIDFKEREREFKGVEWWYQAYKVAVCEEGTREMYDDIVDADTAREAKELGKQVPLDDDELLRWNGFEAVKAMTEGCLAKFWQNKDCAQLLLATKDRYLIEHRPDPIWGDNLDGSGQNLQGQVLMLVRAVIS